MDGRTRFDIAVIAWWLVAALSLGALCAALWTGPIPPIRLLVEEIIRVDAWQSLERGGGIASLVTPVGGWAGSDIFATRIAGTVADWTDAIEAIRLASLFGAMLLLWTYVRFAARAGRSTWLCLIAVPLAWAALRGGGWTHLYGLATLFAGMRLASLVGARPTTTGMLSLALVATGGAALSPLDVPVIAIGIGWMLLASARRWRALLVTATLAPALAVYWMTSQTMPVDEAVGATLGEALRGFFAWGFDHSTQSADGALMVLIIGAWLVLLASGSREHKQPGSPTKSLDERPVRDRPMVILVVLLGALFFIQATHDEGGGARVLVPLILVLMIVPRVDANRITNRMALAAIGVTTILSSWAVTRGAKIHVQDDVAALASLVDALPAEKRVACVGTDAESFMSGRPLQSICPALVQTRSAGITTAHAALLATSHIVRGRQGAEWPQVETGAEWQGYTALRDIDYTIVRGQHRAPGEDLAARLEIARGVYLESVEWALYEVIKQPRNPTTLETLHGGAGGQPIAWDCPAGMALSGLVVTTTRDGLLVGSLQPRCRALAVAAGKVTYRGRTVLGPRFGGKRQYRRKTLACPRLEVVVGLFGRASDVVDQLGLLCASATVVTPAVDAPEEIEPILFEDTDSGAPSGGDGGAAFGSPCPQGSVITGLRGRYGAAVDATGVACSDVHEVLATRNKLAPAKGSRQMPGASRLTIPAPPTSRTRDQNSKPAVIGD